MTKPQLNDLSIYDDVADQWWSDDIKWVRTLKSMVPGRLKWFDRHIDWAGKRVLDLGCAGGFMAEALAAKGAIVTGIDPAAQAIEAARVHAAQIGHEIRYDVGGRKSFLTGMPALMPLSASMYSNMWRISTKVCAR